MPSVSPVADILQQKAETSNTEKTENLENAPKKRGRPPKDPNAPPKASKPVTVQSPTGKLNISGIASTPQGQMQETMIVRRRRAAKMAVGAVQQSGVMLGGEAGKMSKEERDEVQDAFEVYMEAKNINDVPPTLGLVFALSMYYGRVAVSPQAAPKTVSFMMWVKNKTSGFVNFILRRKMNARFNSGNDGQRENNTSEVNPTETKVEGNA